jgi:hypothetical protein
VIRLELVNHETIAVKFENFMDKEIKDKIKKLPGSKYEAENKEWVVKKEFMD